MAYGDNPGKRTPPPRKKRKPKKAKPYVIPKTHKPEATTRKETPKAGPPSPQRTGKPSRPQPIARKRDAAPTTHDRPGDVADKHKGDKLKQSKKYIDTLRDARGRKLLREGPTHEGILKGFRKSTPAEAVKRDDADAAGNYDRFTPPKPKETKGPPTPADKVKKQKPLDPFKDASPDRPRTTSEYRRFLKSGDRPYKKLHPKATHGAGQGVATSGMKILEQSARGLHANVGAIRGKNWWKEFKHGHDTGSDLLKDAGVKNKYVKAIGGFALDIPLSGGGLKATARAPAKKLEQEAARAETKARKATGAGRLAKADRQSKKVKRKREQAKEAHTNRGVGIGVEARVPFTSKGVSKTVGEKTTAKVGKAVRAPQAAEKIVRGNRAGRAAGRAFSPHYRERDVTPEFHERHTELKRHRSAKDRDADREAARRGKAYEHTVKGKEDEILQAVERQPHVPITNVKRESHVRPEHKAATAAKRKVRSLRLRVARTEGKAKFQTGQQNRATISGILKRYGGGGKLTTEVHARLDELIAKGGHEGDMARVVKRYRMAASARIAAGHELANARKGYGNAARYSNQTLPVGDKLTAKVAATKTAEAKAKTAGAELRAAEGELIQVAERHAGLTAAGKESTPLARYDRRSPGTLKTLESQKGALESAKAEQRVAEKAAKGLSRHERVLIDTETKRPVKDVLAERSRHEIADLTDPVSKAAAGQIRHELDELDKAQRAVGIYPEKTPDYFPHQTPPTERELLKRGKGGRKAKPGHANHREDPRDAGSQNMGEPGKVDTSIGRVMAKYRSNAKKAINDAEYLQGLKEIGRKYTKGAVREDEALVEITPRGVRSMEDAKGRLDEGLIEAADDGNLVVLPRSVAIKEVVGRGPVDMTRMEAMGGFWDRLTAGWKTTVTVYNAPFYQERNLMDDTLRFWMGDGNPLDWVRAAKLVHQLRRAEGQQVKKIIPGDPLKMTKVKVAGHEMTGREFIDQALADSAIRAGHYGGELEEMIRAGKQVGDKNPLNWATEHLRDFGTNLEDIPRLATYKSALERGLSRKDAAAWTRLHHFDYTELTETEKAIRRFIPFYTFTSRNMQLQLRKATTRPGKFAIIQAFREEMAKLAGLDTGWEDQYLDETQKRALPVPIRFGDKPEDVKLLYFGFSTTDLNRVPLPRVQTTEQITKQQFDLFMQMVHPVIKGGLEWSANYSFFFRQAIRRTPDSPDAPRWVPAPVGFGPLKLAGLPDSIKKAIGYTEIKDPRTGKMIPAWFAGTDYLVRQLPQTGFVATLSTPVKNSRDQTAGDRLRTQLTGVRQASLDPTKGEAARIRFELGTIEAELNDLEDRGKTLIPGAKYTWGDRKTALEDRKKKLTERYAKVTKRRATVRTQRQAPSYEDQVKKRIQDRLKKYENPDAYYQEKYGRKAETEKYRRP